MTTLHLLALTLVGALPARTRDDRGWVLVTVMSAGIVGVLTIVAQEELSSLLRRALRQVQ